MSDDPKKTNPDAPSVDDDPERDMERRVGGKEDDRSGQSSGNDAARRDRAEDGKHRGESED